MDIGFELRSLVVLLNEELEQPLYTQIKQLPERREAIWLGIEISHRSIPNPHFFITAQL